MDLDKVNSDYRYRLSQERKLEKSTAFLSIVELFLVYGLFSFFFSKIAGLLFLVLFLLVGFILFKQYTKLRNFKLSAKEKLLLNVILLKNYIEEHTNSKTPTNQLIFARERLKIILDNFSSSGNYFFIRRGLRIDESISSSMELFRFYLKKHVKEIISEKFTHENLLKLSNELNSICEFFYEERFDEINILLLEKNIKLDKTPLRLKLWDKFYKMDLKENIFTLILLAITLLVIVGILTNYGLFNRNNLIDIMGLLFGAFILYGIIKPFSPVLLEKIDIFLKNN